jgi:hypothetical protein
LCWPREDPCAYIAHPSYLCERCSSWSGIWGLGPRVSQEHEQILPTTAFGKMKLLPSTLLGDSSRTSSRPSRWIKPPTDDHALQECIHESIFFDQRLRDAGSLVHLLTLLIDYPVPIMFSNRSAVLGQSTSSCLILLMAACLAQRILSQTLPLTSRRSQYASRAQNTSSKSGDQPRF